MRIDQSNWTSPAGWGPRPPGDLGAEAQVVFVFGGIGSEFFVIDRYNQIAGLEPGFIGRAVGINARDIKPLQLLLAELRGNFVLQAMHELARLMDRQAVAAPGADGSKQLDGIVMLGGGLVLRIDLDFGLRKSGFRKFLYRAATRIPDSIARRGGGRGGTGRNRMRSIIPRRGIARCPARSWGTRRG